MSPEQRIAQLERTVAALAQRLDNLGNSTTIPFNVEKALKQRIAGGLQEQLTDITSIFTPPFFDQAVNEGGAASYSVMTTPEYALKVNLGSLSVAIPAFDY